MKNIYEVAKILLEVDDGLSEENLGKVVKSYGNEDQQREVLEFVEESLIPQYEEESIPIQEHPLRDEIIKLLKEGRLTIS